MTKPKYCSWDVRDLAADHGWSEESDERDVTNVRLSKKYDNKICVSVHLQTGLTQVHLEKTDQDRIPISSAVCTEFSELEEIISKTEFFNSENSLERNLDKSVRKTSQLKSSDECIVQPSKEVVYDGDNFAEIRSLIKSWDNAEKV